MAKDLRGLLLWVAFALCAVIVATPGHAAVGRTTGSFNVSNSGAATYTIPIFTPPGPHGVQPSVALAYSSNTDKGPLGRGWSLTGFSSIERCSKTIAQDGVGAGYVLIADDAYCLDGNRLRRTGGSAYGTSGSVYMTEMADFSRITANGTAGHGPQYWTVERKDGWIYTYGGTTDSRAIGYPNWYDYTGAASPVVWKLSEIRDRAGNKVRFTWKTADSTTASTTHPVKIEWTQTSAGSGSYVYSMDFIYSAGGNSLASTPYRYYLGSTITDSDLLTAITVSVSGTVKRKYVLTYDTSTNTGAKRLTQVKECSDSAATDCLSPTNITYQNGTAGVNLGSPALSLTGAIDGANGDYDFNGDGIKDIAYSISGTWYVRLGSASSGYGSAISTGMSYLHVGKLLGNSADQLLSDDGYGNWYIYYLNGSSFSSVSTGITGMGSSYYVVISDIDGDGRSDLVWTGDTGWIYNHLETIYFGVFRNTSTAGSPSFASPVYPSIYLEDYVPPGFYENLPEFTPDGYGFHVVPTLSKGGDSNANGREELNLTLDWEWCYEYWGTCNYGGATTQKAFVFADSGTYLSLQYSYPGITLLSKDYDRDGCDDFGTDVYGGTEIALSDCSRADGGVAWLGGTPSYGLGTVGAADWTGDGVGDFFVDSGSTLYAYPLIAGQLGTAINTGISTGSGCVLIRTDGNGDDLDDFGCLVPGSSLTLYIHNGTAVVPDLVSQIEDGFGVTYSPSYVSIQRGNYTPYTNGAYPYRDVKSDRRVVGTVTASDGIGGTYTTTYAYYGALQNVEGRGFVGFDKIESVDSRNGIKHEQQFERAFPYSGMAKIDKLYQPSGSGGFVINSKTITASSTTLDATAYNQRYFTYISAVDEDSYEVGGTKNGDWITHTALSSSYDTSGNLTASTKTVTDKDTSSPHYTYAWVTATSSSFTPNSTYWCLGLPDSTSVTSSTTTGEASVTRSKSFTPDYANCRMDAESVEPSSSTLRVDTAYGYDGFGNVNSVSVTGRNPNGTSMTARTTTTNRGTTGQFPVSVTNPLSQTSTRTFDSTFGSLLTETDPNSIVVTNNTYDSFGRISYVTRPDGSYTAYSYVACATYGCENGDPGSGVTGINKVVTAIVERDSSSATISTSFVYADLFDRPIVQISQSMAGQWLRSGRQYDALGRVYRETAPCMYGSCSVYWTTNTYDLLGRLSAQSSPTSDSNSTSVTTTFAYTGRTQTITDPNSKVTTKVMDVNGWMRRSRDHDSYGQNFSYDAAGSLTAVTDTAPNPLFSASYYYGAKPFQYATTDMDLGTWGYTYNSLGELVSWTDANSNSFSQTYDALSRVLTRTEAEGTTTWTYGTSAGSHNIGQLAGVSMSGSSYSEALSYDSVGRPSTRAITADSNTYNIDYAYNNQGSLDTLTYPTSTSSTRVKVKYGYAYGILQTITDWTSGSAGTVYWTANAKNPRGQTTQETLGNGVVTNRGFDAVTGRLNSIQSGVSGGTALQNQSYLYDAIGNVTQRQENTLGLTESFYYDNLYRLDHSTLNNGGGAATNLQMAYDAMGNITQRSDVNGNASWTYHSTKKHAVASTGSGGATYSYDANGNMTSRNGQTIGWASYNYPTYLATATENTTFYYGPDRQYYRQDYSGPSTSETTYYIGGILEKVNSGGVTDWRHYIVAEGQTVAIVSRESSSTNSVSYPLEDNQGSGSTLTNSSGSLLVRESFNAFGLPRDGSDWDGAVPSGDLTTIEGLSRRGYTGHSMLGRMGLIHMNGRVQDAITGRFLSPDPNIPDPGFTQSYNRYAYVNNNPMSYTDPSGFIPNYVPGTNMTPEQYTRNYQTAAMWFSAFCGGAEEMQSPECSAASQEFSYYQGLYQGMELDALARETAQRVHGDYNETILISIQISDPDAESRGGADGRSARAQKTSILTPQLIESARAVFDVAAELASKRAKWAEVGRQGEIAAREAFATRGYIVLAEQLYVKTSAGVRITDFVVTGGRAGLSVVGFEVKVNGSPITPLQAKKDALIETEGGTISSLSKAGFDYGDRIRYKTYLMAISMTYL